MVVCAVYGCTTNQKKAKEKGLRLFRFPKDSTLQEIWLNACKRGDPINVKTARICSLHFRQDAMEKPMIQSMLQYSPKSTKKLKADAVPTEFLPWSTPSNSEVLAQKSSRDNRAVKRENHSIASSLLTAATSFTDTSSSNTAFSGDVTAAREEDHSSPFDCLLFATKDDYAAFIGSEKTASATVPMETDANNVNSVNFNIKDEEIERLKKELQESKEQWSYLNSKVTSMQEKINQLEDQVAYYRHVTETQEANHETKVNAKVREILKGKFTEGQIDVLLSGKKRKKEWSQEDIAEAISLRSVSPKAYRYLREQKKHPYPGLSTLRTHAGKFTVTDIIQQDILLLMKSKADSMTLQERVTCLSFDDMHLSTIIALDRREERVIGPHRRVQVVFARGLLSKWKQPIFYDFDFGMTKEKLLEIINALHDCEYNVVSVTSDMGATNMSLWKSLQVTHTNSSFLHPITSEKVFVLADPPHLLKLLRNHLLDGGFVLKDDAYIGKGILQSLVNLETTDVRVGYKISQGHLDIKGPQRQRVKPAANLLSNTTASAIEFFGSKGKLQRFNWKEAAEVVRLCNDWFDVLNSSMKWDKNEGRHAYGMNIKKQEEVLRKMDELMYSMKVHKKNDLMPFQKGIILSNMSLRQLYSSLKEKFRIVYILTRRLNQDVLENFFSYIRGMGGRNEYPSALCFQHRLRWYVLGKHSDAIFTAQKNTEDNSHDTSLVNLLEDDKDEVMSSAVIRNAEIVPEVDNVNDEETKEEITLQSDVGVFISHEISQDDFELLKQFESEVAEGNHSIDTIEEEGLCYIAGYVAHRFSKQCPILSADSVLVEKLPEKYDWISYVSRGNLTRPSEDFMNVAKIMDAEFKKVHGNAISHDSYIITKVINMVKAKVPSGLPPDDVLHCLVRTRTYIRIRALNRDIQSRLSQKKIHYI